MNIRLFPIGFGVLIALMAIGMYGVTHEWEGFLFIAFGVALAVWGVLRLKGGK